MKSINQIVAAILLLVLGLAIIPAETFHHHHEESVLCKVNEIHLEAKHFECELCQFVLPTLIQESKSQSLLLSESNFLYVVKNTPSGSSTFFDIPQYRGPPEHV